MYYERKIEPKIRKHLDKKEYTIVTGARQTGKTTLITQLFREQQKKTDRVFYISFENADVLRAINKNPENIFRFALRPEIPDGQINKLERITLFIDEIQYANNPSHFLKHLYDKYLDRLKIVATGSSAFYMDTTFTDSLAGRKRIFVLQTLSFEEYLSFINRQDLITVLQNMRAQTDFISTQKDEMLEQFNQYLIFGGYPSVALETDVEEKTEMLSELKNAFLKRDIDESGISNVDAFYKVSMILSGQAGNLVNKNELSNTIGVDNKTIEKYLFVLQKCFHIELVRPFSGNMRKELTKMPMVYFYDTGMRNSLINRFFPFAQREDRGQLLENYVFKRLSEKYNPDEIRFWRTTDQKEIDFIVNAPTRQLAYEVKVSCNKKRNKSKEVFLNHYPEFSYRTISYDFDDNCLQALKL